MRSKIAQKILDETPAELRFPTRSKPHREPLVFNGIDFNRRLDLEKKRIHHSISMSRIIHNIDCKARRDKEMIFRAYKETGFVIYPSEYAVKKDGKSISRELVFAGSSSKKFAPGSSRWVRNLGDVDVLRYVSENIAIVQWTGDNAVHMSGELVYEPVVYSIQNFKSFLAI
ncbi:MAG: hypothetical protein EBW87_05610 [Burkholderiaceae bacterium]|nr:hypothetical protein [Burkholderiaceae bacterium]